MSLVADPEAPLVRLIPMGYIAPIIIPAGLSVRASSSPYIGDEGALYRSAEALSVCSF
jgi:hypothetical protein